MRIKHIQLNRTSVIYIAVLVLALGFIAWKFYEAHHLVKTSREIPYGNVDVSKPPAGFAYGQSDPKQAPADKAQVLATADAYVISKMGEQNFRQFVEQVPRRHAFASPKDSVFDFLAYRFKPDRMYAGEPASDDYDVTFAQVNRTNLKEVYADFVPHCLDIPNQCKFTVTRQQAIDIAKKRGLHGELTVSLAGVESKPSDKTALYRLLVTSCTDKAAAVIDYTTGELLMVGKGCEPFIID